MYYGGGQEETYSYAILAYYAAFALVPFFLATAIVLFINATKKKTHKKLLYGLSIAALVVSLASVYVLAQGKPRCCGEGYTYIQSAVRIG